MVHKPTTRYLRPCGDARLQLACAISDEDLSGEVLRSGIDNAKALLS